MGAPVGLALLVSPSLRDSPIARVKWCLRLFLAYIKNLEPSPAQRSGQQRLVMSALRRLTLTSRRTMFSFAKKSLWPVPPNPGPPIPQKELVDEEACPDYNSAHFYPAKPGEVLANKFQLLVKIGWGSQSTVWLARDISRYLPTLGSVCLLPVD